MKNFLSKYWKRILIIIASIFIVINVIGKCVAPRKLIDEFAKYGPDIERKENIIGTVDTSEVVNNVKESSPLDDDMTRIVLALGGGLLAVTIISEIANKKSGGKKK